MLQNLAAEIIHCYYCVAQDAPGTGAGSKLFTTYERHCCDQLPKGSA